MNELFTTNFGAMDWWIVGVYLTISIAVGIFANRYIHSTSAYLVGGRASGTALNVATYIGTGLGLVTLMYASIDAFSHGFAYVTLALIGVFTGIVLGSTGLVIKPLRERNLLTIPEFFEERFNRKTRILAGCICAFSGIVNMGLFPKMGATFITYATGIGASMEDAEITVNIITSILIILVLTYTVLGGMVSVIITDYVQFVILSIGMGLGVYFCLSHPDLGWERMLSTIGEHRGEMMFNPVAEGSYGWSWIVFNALVFLIAGFCWAPEATRALTARNPSVAKRTFLFAVPGQFIRLAIPALWAVAAFTLIAQNQELTHYFFPNGLAEDPAKGMAGAAMPLALGKIVPAGLLGILVAGLMAAFMSTHDSYLLCWASVISRDVINPLRKQRPTDKEEIRVTRICVVLVGVFLLAWGVWYKLPESVWEYMAVSGTIYLSGAGIALVGGIYWRRASTVGALASMITGLFAIAGLFIENVNSLLSRLDITFELTGVYVGLFNYALCGTVFVVFSLLFPDKAREDPENLPASSENMKEGHA